MKSRVKTALSLLTSAVFIILAGCSNADSMMKMPGRYLLNGTLSEHTDANNFAYYINGNEAYVARGSSTSTTPEVPATVTLNGTTYDVTGVYHDGFANSNITAITLPLSITTIDYQAFAGSALTSAVIPCNVEEMGSGAYMNCHSLTAVQFKNDESAGSSNLGVCGAGGSGNQQAASGSSHLEEIPDYCFFNDENLTTLSLPRSLTTVNSCAFQACRSLEKVAFLSNFTTLKKYAFESCVSLTDVYFPNSFTTATNNTSNCDPLAFYRVNRACTVHLSSANENDYNVWNNSTAWRSYNDEGASLTLAARTTSDIGLGSDYLYRVENGEATIFSYAPSSFPASGVVVMPNEIDGYLVGKAEATTYSAYLTSVTQMYLSKNLKSLENSFFAGMTNLTTVSSTGNGCYTVADNVIDLSEMSRLESVGEFLFCTGTGGANLATKMGNDFTGQVILPKCLKTIGTGAFCNLKKASQITISATTPSESLLESIGDYAFYNFGYSKIKDNWGDDSALNFFELTLPSTCTSIGSNAFNLCYGLRKIEFLGAAGKSLTIKSSAFLKCRSLEEIVFPKEDDSVSIGASAFEQCSAGDKKGFLDIKGIQEVYFPSNVTSIGDKAFGNNERACFYFAASSKPSNVNNNFNIVSKDNLADATTPTDTINGGKESGSAAGYIEHAPVYYGIGYEDGSSSSKRRYIRTNDFGFVETGIGTNQFICARYLFNPKSLSNNAKVTVTVPEYIKYQTNPTNPFDGETGTNTDFKVVSIGDSCFSASYSRKNKKLYEVNVPHSIKRIGDNAFARSIYFNKLSSYKGNTTDAYNFPESLKYIGRTAFIFTRLTKALNIPGDVLSFDMIDPSVIATGSNPVDFSSIDNSTPRNYASGEWQPRRFGCMFSNDWYLNEVTFTTVNNPNFSVDTTTRTIYRLNKIGSDGTLSSDIQLMMVMARLKTYNVDSTTNESNKTLIDAQSVVLGGTGYEFMSGMSSIRYGAFKVATWIQGLYLDTSLDVFPKVWNSNNVLPQNLFLGINGFPSNLQIGAAFNDSTYWSNCQSIYFTGSGGNFSLPSAVCRCCTDLSSMTFPQNLTTIPDRAFDRAVSISTFITPDSNGDLTIGGEDGNNTVLDLRYNTALTYIGRSAFYGNTKITKVYTAPNLSSLGIWIWQENTALTYVDMSVSTSLTTLTEQMFQSDTSLITAILAPNLQSIGKNCFANDPIENITWPSGGALTSIGESAFSGNRIEHLLLPDTVNTISTNAFINGSATTIVRLPTALASIENTCFRNNNSINQVYVGNARTGRTDGSVDLKNNTFGPNVKYAILPNTAKFSSMPFGTCTDLKCVFYGRKYSEIKTSERNRNLAKYAAGTEDADLYYFTETADDMSVPNALYWRYKPGSLDIVQVMDSNYNVTAEYDFSTEIS